MILYGNGMKPYNQDFAKKILNILRFNVDELVVIGNPSPEYLASMSEGAKKSIQYLTLMAYSGKLLKNPCSVFPYLEELTLEDSNIDEISVDSCVCLTKVWIRDNAAKVRQVSV